jgi:hypothetical protein
MVFVFDGGVVTESDVAAFTFSDGEILSAGTYTAAEVRTLVKPLLADRIAVALEAAHDGTTALCDHGKRIG